MAIRYLSLAKRHASKGILLFFLVFVLLRLSYHDNAYRASVTAYLLPERRIFLLHTTVESGSLQLDSFQSGNRDYYMLHTDTDDCKRVGSEYYRNSQGVQGAIPTVFYQVYTANDYVVLWDSEKREGIVVEPKGACVFVDPISGLKNRVWDDSLNGYRSLPHDKYLLTYDRDQETITKMVYKGGDQQRTYLLNAFDRELVGGTSAVK